MNQWKLKDLWQENSELWSILNFYTPGQSEDGEISKFGAMSLGILWCEGTIEEKA